MLDSLITHADTTGAPNVVGRYRLLRVCPDPVADEWFNVGIYFESADGSRDYRLLENMEAFKCLYGAHGVGTAHTGAHGASHAGAHTEADGAADDRTFGDTDAGADFAPNAESNDLADLGADFSTILRAH